MIRQSHPWKRELRRLRRVLAKIALGPLDEEMADYTIEKPLLQSAIIVRRLIESWKITDATCARKWPLSRFPSRPNRLSSMTRLTMQGDIDKEFNLEARGNTSMDAWNLTSELIHSGYINWEVDEEGRFTAIYLASIRNQASRLLRIPVVTYLALLEAIDTDHVESIHTSFGKKGELIIKIA